MTPEQRAEAARRNREQMPETGKEIDKWNEVFGPVKVKWAIEYANGRSVGRVPEEMKQ